MPNQIQVSARHEINLHARKLDEYEWFSEGNRQKAQQALESYAYARFNNVPNLPVQYKAQAISALNKDKAEKAVYAGNRLNMAAKLFAVHEGSMLEPFAIKSGKFDWKVIPIQISKEPVPDFVMRNLMAFRQAGIVFDTFAVAVPGNPNYVPAKYALQHETKRTLSQIGMAAKKVAKSAAAATSTVAVGASAVVVGAIAVPAAAVSAFLSDPVFLGSYGENPSYLVEIGRWE